MTQNVLEQLDTLHLTLLQLEDLDEQFTLTLQSRLTTLADQVPILRRLASISNLVKKGADLPVRRINYNVRKLSEDCKPRWNEVLKLNCETVLFLTIAFNGLGSLPQEEFSWLVHNTEDYVENRAFPAHWILRGQIRKVVSKMQRTENTKPLLAS